MSTFANSKDPDESRIMPYFIRDCHCLLRHGRSSERKKYNFINPIDLKGLKLFAILYFQLIFLKLIQINNVKEHHNLDLQCSSSLEHEAFKGEPLLLAFRCPFVGNVQTGQTQIRRRRMHHLIRVSIVY